METQAITEDTGHNGLPFLLIGLLVALFLAGIGYAEYRSANTTLRPVSEVTLEINKILDSGYDAGYKDLTLLALAVSDADVTLRSYDPISPIGAMVKRDREFALNEAVKSLTQQIRDGD